MRRIVITLLALMLAIPAATAPAQNTELVFVDAEVNMVDYMSGGVGKGERKYLESLKEYFNLKLEFSRPDGSYVADVPVMVKNSASGAYYIHAVSQGPLFYADLPAGTYEVTAAFDLVQRTTQVTVGEDGLETIRMQFPK